MTSESPAGGMTDTVAETRLKAQQVWNAIRFHSNSELIVDLIAKAITTARAEALREAAAVVRELSVAMHKQPATGHPHDHLARECGDAALQSAAELVEALIKTDSGGSIDPAES